MFSKISKRFKLNYKKFNVIKFIIKIKIKFWNLFINFTSIIKYLKIILKYLENTDFKKESYKNIDLPNPKDL